MVMVLPITHDSAASSCFRGCPVFLHGHFPLQSPPSHPLKQSFHSQHQPSPWDCSTIPKVQPPVSAPYRGPASMSRVCIAVAKTVSFSIHLDCHRSTVSLAAIMFLLWLRKLSKCGDWNPASVCPLTEGRSSPTNTPISPTSSFVLLSFLVLHILLHWPGTPVCSQLVFCMHLCVWRCIPDVPLERDVLHIHLLLHHFVPYPLSF